MDEVRKADNVFEAIRMLSPEHPVLNGLQSNGFAFKMRTPFPTLHPDGSIRMLTQSHSVRLYRGECGVFPTCQAGIYRVSDSQVRVVELLRAYHFMLAVRDDPEVVSWKNNHLYVNYWLLAQHYEFRTPVLDLTDEIVVAAFFATHRYDPVIRGYAIQDTGDGVMRCCMDPLRLGRALDIAGQQPLARPTLQDGYALWMRPTDDFATMSKRIVFKQDEKINKCLNRVILGGEDYFPPETISLVAREIRETDLMPRRVIEAFLADGSVNSGITGAVLSFDDMERILHSESMHIVDTDSILLPEFAPNPDLRLLRSVVQRPAWHA